MQARSSYQATAQQQTVSQTRVSVEREKVVYRSNAEEIKDRIIVTYKDELKIQPTRERDYRHLADLIADLQRRTKAFELYISDAQRDYEDTLNSQNKAISHEQASIESLKKTISDREHEGSKILDEIASSKREIEERETEIYITNRDVEAVRKANENLRREIEFVQQDIFQSQDLKKRQSQSLYQLKNDLRFQEKEVDEQKTKLSVLEKEYKTLTDRSAHISNQLDQKSVQVSQTSQRLDGVERDIVIVRQSIHSIDVDINDAERSNDRAIEYQKQLLRQKD